MTDAPLRILLVSTYYPQLLAAVYESRPEAASWTYDRQQRWLAERTLSVFDACADALRLRGLEVCHAICNADALQGQWAQEHHVAAGGNIHERRREIIAGQARSFRPDVIYVFEWCPLGDDFLAELKARAGLLAGQISSPLRPERTYAAYDLMISSWPPIVDYFRREGKFAEHLKLAFDERAGRPLSLQPKRYNVSFVGGFGPSHPDRVQWLEGLLDEFDIDIFGYGIENTPCDTPIRRRHHGPVWGRAMYEILCQSHVTLNRHAVIDVRGVIDRTVAANMRLYEATGVGTCLLTDGKSNLCEILEPGQEAVVYENEVDCREKLRYLLGNDQARCATAEAGRRRTLREHTYTRRMEELAAILCRYYQRMSHGRTPPTGRSLAIEKTAPRIENHTTALASPPG